jgi:hypothetical protein
VVSSLKVEEALDVARRFVVVRLNGASGSILPISAVYVGSALAWTVVLGFQQVGSTIWLHVQMTIRNSDQEVVSFHVTRAEG